MIYSIIIPTKNEEEHLPLLLESIKKQTFKDLEVIVADAKSTDKTREVAMNLGARVVEGGMPGPGRNRGAEAAKGEMLLFLDADAALPDPDFLKKSLEEMKRKNFCVAAPFYDFRGANIMDKIVSGLWNAWVSLASHFSPSATGSCIFATKAIHDKIGGFDEKIILGEDTDYVYRASKYCRFGVIRSVRAENSPRRLHQVGYAKVFWQVFAAAFYRYIMRRTDTSNQFDYNFNIYKNKKDVRPGGSAEGGKNNKAK
jgi:glycosyltransferase involved in cell wall biosynthesis